MFGQAEYDRYASLMEKSSWAYQNGDMERYEQLIIEADIAYHIYEFASGLKSEDY